MIILKHPTDGKNSRDTLKRALKIFSLHDPFRVHNKLFEEHTMLAALSFFATLLCFTPLIAIIIAANTAPKSQ